MTVRCVKCWQDQVVSCTDEQYLRWKDSGLPIQRAMPDVPAAERELLISGYCDDCFKALFPDEEDD